MARAPDTGDAFVREVDEEYRRDQMARAWSRYGRWLLLALGLFLVAVAGYLYWRNVQAQEAAQRAQLFNTALGQLQSDNLDAAAPALTRLADAPEPGYRALALLAQAAVATQRDDNARAIATYQQLQADEGLPQPFRDLALLKSMQLEFDRLAPQAIIQRLQPLAQPGNPWFGTAGEMTALAYMRQNRPDLAGPLFLALARDEGVPPSIRARAQQMASFVGVSTSPPAPAPAPASAGGQAQ